MTIKCACKKYEEYWKGRYYHCDSPCKHYEGLYKRPRRKLISFPFYEDVKKKGSKLNYRKVKHDINKCKAITGDE